MSDQLRSGLLSESDLALFADYYEFTMGKADFEHGNFAAITENYFIRRAPQGAFMVVAGLEQVIRYVTTLRFGEDDLLWLKRQLGGDASDGFIDYLRHFKFTGDIYAMPEGRLAFPNEPIINVTGPSPDVQLLETCLLNVMNFQTLVATKTARVVYAARGRSCVDFGARRAHGRDAAVLGARAAYLGGADGTSLVVASRLFGIPCVGTMAHKFVQDREDELQAFREYASAFPSNTILLIDTYDSLEGARRAAIVGKELKEKGFSLRGVRLDSGDIAVLSRQVRGILDEAGLTETKIFVSGDLDEFVIDKLLSEGAPVDSFGVGTRLITGAHYNPLTGQGGVSAMPGIFKHVERIEDGCARPTSKVSDERAKTTLPGRKQAWRRYDGNGAIAGDVISLWKERAPDAEPLLAPVVVRGKLVYDFPSLAGTRETCEAELKKLPERYRRLSGAEEFPVEVSPSLGRMAERVVRRRRSRPQS